MIGPPASVNTFCTSSTTVIITTLVLNITVDLILKEMCKDVCLECRL